MLEAMTGRLKLRLVLSLLALVTLGFSPCGAEMKDSPTLGQAPLHPETCKTFTALSPALDEALKTDDVSGLRSLVSQLSQPPEGGGAPPLNQVLQALFVALHAFAADPPETGNTDGLCNLTSPPPLAQTNRLCDLRRALKIYVHEGKASKSLHAFDPIVAGVLDYITGKLPASDVPHYEIARDLELMCTQTGQCDPHHTFALIKGVTAYLTPGRAQQTLTHVQTLLDDPRLLGNAGLLQALAGGGTDGGAGNEAGFELITDELICAVSAIDPSAPPDAGGPFGPIDQLLTGTLYPLIDNNYPPKDIALPDGGTFHSDLHAEIAVGADDLKRMLDPNLPEPVLQPLQQNLACLSVASTPEHPSLCGKVLRPGFVPMIFHLGFEAKVVGLTQIVDGARELVNTDAASEEPGMVMLLLHDVAATLDRDDEALSALTTLCHTALATERPCDDGAGHDCPALPLNFEPSGRGYAPHADGCSNGAGVNYQVASKGCRANAEAVIPEVGRLFEKGVTDQTLCVVDTLVYGCTGGAQPACGTALGP
jgi:hypothetical protein